ncbi:MAG: PAS domain S-box protein [Deltaproteobacteria bacterium]|nr:PAS domain S-box protein [Deltaproteobacteria bacterium]
MNKFIRQTIKRVDKLDCGQVQRLLYDMVDENELLAMVTSSIDAGMIISDNQHRIMHVNRPLQRIMPVMRGNHGDMFSWEVIEDSEISEFVRTSLLNKETIRDREYILDVSGRTIILRLSILPLVNDGTIRGNLVYVQDVTRLKNQEARLRRAEGLVSLSTMTAGIAHEIKNPLGSMAIYIQLMQKMLKKEGEVPREELLSYLDIVNEEVDRLNSIVVDYLFAVKPIDATLLRRDLNGVLDELMEFIGKEMEFDGIKVVYHADEHLPWIQLDENLIKQALLNLIKNAQHAMEGGGVLTVNCVLKEDHIVLSIGDTGSGMPREVQEKIFEPYFTTKDTGTGLGLTVVYKIIKEHGGEIDIHSREGEGTTFFLSFPVPQEGEKLLSYDDNSAEEVIQ